MRIAVSGCGIAGAAVAYLLAKSGHRVTIFEQATECKPVGAGIMLQPSGQRVLEQLGILEAIEDRSARIDGLDAWLPAQRPLIQLRYSALSPGIYALGVHRGLLFDQLLNLCDREGVTVVTSSRIERYDTHPDHVSAVDHQGRVHAPFEFLIATDGARSQLRLASGIASRSVDYDYGAIWMTGPCSAVQSRLHQVIDGATRLVGLLPIGEGRCSLFWGLRNDQHQDLLGRGLGAWKREVAALCPAAEELLESIRSFDQATLGGYRHVRMRRWHAERVVFLGDAAHPSSPHLGQGANLALEDAVCFAEALADGNDFHAACRRFQQIRQSKIRYYQQLTRLLTPFFQSDLPLLAWGRNLALPLFPRIGFLQRRMLTTLCGAQNGWFRSSPTHRDT